MKIVETVLERKIKSLVNLDEMQFDFMFGKQTDALFIVRRLQEEYQTKEKKAVLCVLLIWKRHMTDYHEE